MRVLISGYYGFHNIGDEAILKSIIIALRQEKPDIKITVLSNDIEHTKKTYNVDAINRWNIFKIYLELLKSDGLISGGGSLLQDVTSSRPITYYTTIMKLAKLARKPVFIYAQGVGPISENKNKEAVKKILNKVNYLTLRDKESIDLVKSIGVTKDIEIVPDPVMGFNIDGFKSNICDKYNGLKYITVSVRDWDKANTNFLEKIAKSCDEIVSSGISVVFIPMHGEHDYKTSKKVVDMMNKKAEIFDYNASIEEKILCIKNSKLMIGMRLHALIFAATVNTPMIGISYDPKIDSFLDIVNQPCIGSVDDNWNFSDLSNKALKIISDSSQIKSNLKLNVDMLVNESRITAKKAIEIFG
jgi:polysaccharide pyruvyl transferase CsaB